MSRESSAEPVLSAEEAVALTDVIHRGFAAYENAATVKAAWESIDRYDYAEDVVHQRERWTGEIRFAFSPALSHFYEARQQLSERLDVNGYFDYFGSESVADAPWLAFLKQIRGKTAAVVAAGVAVAASVEASDVVPHHGDSLLAATIAAGAAIVGYKTAQQRRSQHTNAIVTSISAAEKAFKESAIAIPAQHLQVDRRTYKQLMLQLDTQWVEDVSILPDAEDAPPPALLGQSDEDLRTTLRAATKHLAGRWRQRLETMRERDDLSPPPLLVNVYPSDIFSRIVKLDDQPNELWHESLFESLSVVCEKLRGLAQATEEITTIQARNDYTSLENTSELAAARVKHELVRRDAERALFAIMSTASERYADQTKQKQLDKVLGDHRQLLEAATTLAPEVLDHASLETLRVFQDIVFETALSVDAADEAQVTELRGVCDYVAGIPRHMTAGNQAEQFYRGLLRKAAHENLRLPTWSAVADKFLAAAVHEAPSG